MMRFLADENLPGAAVTALRAAGHDVAWVRTDAPGSTDRVILERAVAEARGLVTFDKDFGELAWRFGLPAHCGVVLFRVAMPNPTEVGTLITEVLAKPTRGQRHKAALRLDFGYSPWPLLCVLGTWREGDPISFPVEDVHGGSISMLAASIGKTL